jgi:hypothetical protein
MDILGKLFGSILRVKLLRTFLFNPGTAYDAVTLAKRTQSKLADVKKEVTLLMKIAFVKEKVYVKEFEKKVRKGKKMVNEYAKKKVVGFTMNPVFEYGETLKKVLLDFQFLDRNAIADRFKKSGRVKFFAVSGVFLNNPESRVDILIVGDALNRSLVESEVRKLEAEIGKDLVYALFETQDFLYRVQMYDKFIRDILDFKHERLIEKMTVR